MPLLTIKFGVVLYFYQFSILEDKDVRIWLHTRAKACFVQISCSFEAFVRIWFELVKRMFALQYIIELGIF